MKRVWVFAICVSLIFVPVVASGSAEVRRAVPPQVLSLAAQPSHVLAQGGSVHLVAHVARATTCTFGGGTRAVTVGCEHGVSAVVIAILPNPSTQPRVDRLWVLARGKGGVRRRFVAVFQAARHVAPPTTTTLPQKAATVCSGPCGFTFPQATTSGIISIAMNSVTQGVACSDPGLCSATASQQLDDVNVTVCAGTLGDTDVGAQVENFSLALVDGTQASMDFVSFDSSVQMALGSYGAVAPNQCVTGDVYFDVPINVAWTSLNYSYTSADFSTQTVYAWKA